MTNTQTNPESSESFQSELLRLRNQVQHLAQANAHAAQLMAELEEARELERVLQANNATLKRAQQLGEDRARFLELIARNQPVEALLSALADLTFTIDPSLACSFFLVRQGVLRPALHRALPEPLISSMEGMDWTTLAAFNSALVSRSGPRFHELGPETDSIPLFEKLRAAGRFGLFCLPVTNNSRLLGLLAVYTPGFQPPEAEVQVQMREVAVLFALGVEHRLTSERLTYQAHHDPLTGLPNRTFFYELLQETLDQSRVTGRKAAVLWVDLDRFKQINDTLGHRPADLLLQMVAERLSAEVSYFGVAARMGGDEFVVLVHHISDIADAQKTGEAILNAFRQPFEVGEHRLTVAVSIGVSLFPDHAEDAETLVRNADLAMYGAKHKGRNTLVCFTSEEQDAALESFQLEFHLRRALDHGELEPYYQPLVASHNGSIAAFETLLRWYSPDLGAVSPSQFIPVAEASGLMHEIGQWVLERACRDAASWQRHSPGVRVAVNVSATQLARGDFHHITAQALKTSGLAPELLELELTESTIIGLTDYQRHTEQLRALGVTLAIDDFGTGYSSLSYLHSLHVDKLKIDRSFIAKLGEEEAPTRLTETIIAMAKSLGLRVVAEGIENEDQQRWLTELECDYLQGYFLYHPMPIDEAREVLQSCRLKPARRPHLTLGV